VTGIGREPGQRKVAARGVWQSRGRESGWDHAIHRVLALRDAKVVRFQWFDDCDEALRDAGLEEDR
jgi:hypothetical protein